MEPQKPTTTDGGVGCGVAICVNIRRRYMVRYGAFACFQTVGVRGTVEQPHGLLCSVTNRFHGFLVAGEVSTVDVRTSFGVSVNGSSVSTVHRRVLLARHQRELSATDGRVLVWCVSSGCFVVTNYTEPIGHMTTIRSVIHRSITAYLSVHVEKLLFYWVSDSFRIEPVADPTTLISGHSKDGR